MSEKQKKQRELIMNYFLHRQIPTSCIICGSEDWFVGMIGESYEVAGHTVSPVQVICNFCGRIASYNAMVFGEA